ncbi:MaoC/PaaZ C-terminal domain-containing protein [Burkholderia cenocepacia]|uniref:MaoC/PaaZ C-terminal domain-containing protein n=1 Tax=Burkholderia cenocepacia TaxID=95486 RepID=UPI00285CF99E|nr:MaoC/PaaZ C-terminal domain-containing protein [Burkholderia cenocepacia]MDR8052892.1 acyl dehydratase [Burkholderia cenocepacia]
MQTSLNRVIMDRHENPSTDGFTGASSQRLKVHSWRPSLYGLALASVFKRGREATLPGVKLVRSSVRLDAAHISRYGSICGFEAEQGVPLTYPHILGFALQMQLLTDKTFPWPALGLIHLSNTICQYARLDVGDLMEIEVAFGSLFQHRKGQAFAINTMIYSGDKLVWEGVSTYLKRGVTSLGPPLDILQSVEEHDVSQMGLWPVPRNIGRRYGVVSGDLNPIHLSAFTARCFGFPSAIAHGMWGLARSLATLSPAHPLAKATVQAEFKLPLALPSEVRLVCNPGNPRLFEVQNTRNGEPHLRGMFEFE